MEQILSVTFICNGLLLYLVEELPGRADFKHLRFRFFEIFPWGIYEVVNNPVL